jgi:hypothetical protein
MNGELKPLKLKQTPTLAGKEPADGAVLDPAERPAEPLRLPNGPNAKASSPFVRDVFSEIVTPTIWRVPAENALNLEMIQAFDAKRLEEYKADDCDSELRRVVRKA